VLNVADVGDRRRLVAWAPCRHLRRGELLPAASAEAVVPLRAAGATRRAKAIDAAAVVQELQAPLPRPLAGAPPLLDRLQIAGTVEHALAGRMPGLVLLGHSSIQTTGDVYADWDIDQLAATMADVLEGED
jgi:hypothetical protein